MPAIVITDNCNLPCKAYIGSTLDEIIQRIATEHNLDKGEAEELAYDGYWIPYENLEIVKLGE